MTERSEPPIHTYDLDTALDLAFQRHYYDMEANRVRLAQTELHNASRQANFPLARAEWNDWEEHVITPMQNFLVQGGDVIADDEIWMNSERAWSLDITVEPKDRDTTISAPLRLGIDGFFGHREARKDFIATRTDLASGDFVNPYRVDITSSFSLSSRVKQLSAPTKTVQQPGRKKTSSGQTTYVDLHELLELSRRKLQLIRDNVLVREVTFSYNNGGKTPNFIYGSVYPDVHTVKFASEINHDGLSRYDKVPTKEIMERVEVQNKGDFRFPISDLENKTRGWMDEISEKEAGKLDREKRLRAYTLELITRSESFKKAVDLNQIPERA